MTWLSLAILVKLFQVSRFLTRRFPAIVSWKACSCDFVESAFCGNCWSLVAICLRSPCPLCGKPPYPILYTFQTSHSLGLYGLKKVAKSIRAPSRRHINLSNSIFQSRALSITYLLSYQNLNESWRNHPKKLTYSRRQPCWRAWSAGLRSRRPSLRPSR